MRKVFKGVAIAVPILALASLPFWQEKRIETLTAESAALREQLEEAASARQQAEALLNLERRSREVVGDPPQLELLRLRGQVGVLKRELAEAVKRMGANNGTLITEVGPVAQRPMPGGEEIPATLVDLTQKLAAQKEKLALARQKVADLESTLGVPEEISSLDPTVALGSEDVRFYWPYFEAKGDFVEREQFTRVFETRLEQENVGTRSPKRDP